jgi:hypothetical protein
MSDEYRKDATEEPEVEGHVRAAFDEETEDENEVEGHVRASSVRADVRSDVRAD